MDITPVSAENKKKIVLYGVFKAMGDLLSAVPVLQHEMRSGSKVVLLVFPQLLKFIDLIDFGPCRENLHIHILPDSITLTRLPKVLRDLSQYAPDIAWISPHAPGPASSWKVPLLLWTAKKLYWHHTILAGLHSERLSVLFDIRVPTDRRLPFVQREWNGFSLLKAGKAVSNPPTIRFKESIHRARLQPSLYDLLIHPGAGAANRKWPTSHYAALLEYLPGQLRIAVLGLPADIDAIKALLPTNRNISYLTGSLEEAITHIARSRVALTMDSGNMFFAQVLNVPTISIFGASDPANVIGFEGTVHPLYEQKLSCQPCGMTRCRQQEVYCMTSIAPDTVAKLLLDLLFPSSTIPFPGVSVTVL